jgi:hypothetical protein
MSAAPEPNPSQTVRCAICGRENPGGRPFCLFCKQRLATPPPNEPPVNEELPKPPDKEVLEPPLPVLPDENQALRQQIGVLQAELEQARATNTHSQHLPGLVSELRDGLKAAEDKVAGLAAHAASWEEKWKAAEAKASGWAAHAAGLETKAKSAENKAVVLEGGLAAEAKEVEDISRDIAAAKSSPLLKWILSGLTVVGSLGGYGTGRYFQPKDNTSAKVEQLVAQAKIDQHQIDQKQIDALKASLVSTTATDQNQNQSKAEIEATNATIRTPTAHEQQLERQLRDAASQKAIAADQIRRESKADIDAANRKISDLTAREQQLQRQLREATTQKASVSDVVLARNAEIAGLQAQLAPRGALIWSGNLSRKQTIEIQNGVPLYGTMTGALPKRSCKVSTTDSRVKIKKRPSKNHWNDLSFEVSALGPVQVQINWEITE